MRKFKYVENIWELILGCFLIFLVVLFSSYLIFIIIAGLASFITWENLFRFLFSSTLFRISIVGSFIIVIKFIWDNYE